MQEDSFQKTDGGNKKEIEAEKKKKEEEKKKIGSSRDAFDLPSFSSPDHEEPSPFIFFSVLYPHDCDTSSIRDKNKDYKRTKSSTTSSALKCTKKRRRGRYGYSYSLFHSLQ